MGRTGIGMHWGALPGIRGLAAALCALGMTVGHSGLANSDPFDGTRIWDVEIRLSPENIERLRTDSRTYVTGTWILSGEEIRPVKIKLKGQSRCQKSLKDQVIFFHFACPSRVLLQPV